VSYLIAQLVLGGVTVLGYSVVGRRRRKDDADMAEAEAFIADLRSTS
jgi:hypothetical protein